MEKLIRQAVPQVGGEYRPQGRGIVRGQVGNYLNREKSGGVSEGTNWKPN